MLARWLRFRGLEVTTVRNVTDMSSKILVNSRASYEQAPAAASTRGSRGGRWPTASRVCSGRRTRLWASTAPRTSRVPRATCRCTP
ncbi:hypothetical protein QJS66_09540 [Kocuria rhizophila]|nr:hypothetical protein QJS66_09540 [Kocuria rhizophila]